MNTIMPYFPIDPSATTTLTGIGCVTLDTTTLTDANNLRFYTDCSCPTAPLTTPDPPKAINDIRSIGIPSNAPMFNTTFSWDYAGCNEAITYDPWITTTTGTAGNTTFDIPVNQNYGIAGTTTLTLADTTIGDPFYLRKPLRSP